jgi:hypothetical protein
MENATASPLPDNSIATYMTTAIFPSLLHEDPRYYQMGKGSFAHRAYHGINRLFVTRTDSGHDRLNISESAGNAVAAAISNIYHPAEDRTASRNASTFAFLILYDGLSTKRILARYSTKSFPQKHSVRIRGSGFTEKSILTRCQNSHRLRHYFNHCRRGTQNLAISVKHTGPICGELYCLYPHPMDMRSPELAALQQPWQQLQDLESTQVFHHHRVEPAVVQARIGREPYSRAVGRRIKDGSKESVDLHRRQGAPRKFRLNSDGAVRRESPQR